VLIANVTEMEAIVAKVTPLVPELNTKHQQKIVERLQDALGIASPEGTQTSIPREEIAERIRQEVTMYGIRIDITEELQRLSAHLAETLRDAVLACGKQAIAELIDVRAREGAALSSVLIANVTEMEAIVAKVTPLVPELITKHQQKIVERLQDALGIASPEGTQTSIPREEIAERIRQEVTIYGIRIDITEELQRLSAHLAETRHVLQKGGKVGKRLDFMMQELNREANTLGSKAAAKELADSSMTLKLLIEQMREQVQNLE
jgi:uncharacterized protein YicC (UPF0701 family)